MIAGTDVMPLCYDNRSIDASEITMFGADARIRRGHCPSVLSSTELLAALRRLKDEGVTSNAKLSRLLGLPSPRVVEIFDEKRRITIDEMKVLVEAFSLMPKVENGPTLPADGGLNAAGGRDAVEIVALDLSLSMGPGTLIEDFVEGEPIVMDLAMVQSITRTPSDRLRLVKGIGDSMEPTLRNGDRVMVDINERHFSRINGIYWIDHYGAHGIKRLRSVGKDRLLVISDNPNVQDFEVAADELRIEGRVIWFAREL